MTKDAEPAGRPSQISEADHFAGPRVEALAKSVGWSDAWSESARPVGESPRVIFGIQLLERLHGEVPEAPVVVCVGIDMAASSGFNALRAAMPAWPAKRCAQAMFENFPFATGLARATMLCWADAMGLLEKTSAHKKASEEATEDWRMTRMREVFERGANSGLGPMTGRRETIVEVDANGVKHERERFGETTDLCLVIELPDTANLPWGEKGQGLVSESEMTVELALKMAPFVLEALESVAAKIVGREAVVVSGICETADEFRDKMSAQQERLALQAEIARSEGVWRCRLKLRGARAKGVLKQ